MKLKELLNKQKALDEMILERAGIKNYPYTNIKLALLVELGELANEVQSFKHWKHNKEIKREKVLEEFADCLHFALSIENHLKQISAMDLDVEIRDMIKKESSNDNTFDFLYTYEKVINDEFPLLEVMVLGECLGIDGEEVEKAYLKKHEENYRRQQEGY